MFIIAPLRDILLNAVSQLGNQLTVNKVDFTICFSPCISCPPHWFTCSYLQKSMCSCMREEHTSSMHSLFLNTSSYFRHVFCECTLFIHLAPEVGECHKGRHAQEVCIIPRGNRIKCCSLSLLLCHTLHNLHYIAAQDSWQRFLAHTKHLSGCRSCN